MEGIMMRGPKLTAMAVRNPEGEIVIEKFPTESVARNKFCKLPLIRGIFGYIDSMKFGSKCLMRSAEISGLDQAEEEMKQEKAEKRAKQAGADIVALTDGEGAPIAAHADQLLIAQSDMASFVDSLVAPLSIINAIIVAVAKEKGDELAQRLRRLENIWEEYDVYAGK